MSEQLKDRVEILEFSTIKPGDVVHITTGAGDEAWKYEFTVTDNLATWPDGTLKATSPDGTELHSMPFALHGCGRWTNRLQNPVQKQERGFTPYSDGLVIGSFLLGKSPTHGERLVFDKPGQEISEISVTKS